MKMKKETMLDKGYTAWLKAMLDIAKRKGIRALM